MKEKKIDFVDVLEELTEEFKKASLCEKDAQTQGVNYQNLCIFKALLAIQIVLTKILNFLDTIETSLQKEISRLVKFNNALEETMAKKATELAFQLKQQLLDEILKKGKK